MKRALEIIKAGTSPLHFRAAVFLLMLVILGIGCESELENPADPESDAYLGLEPWVDSGFDFATTIDDTVTLHGVFHGPLDKVDVYEWDVDNDGELDVISESTGIAKWVYAEVGLYKAILSVTDKAGFSKRDTTRILVTNEPPSPDGGPDRSGFVFLPIGLPARGTDDGRIIRYRWDFDSDGEFDWEGGRSDTVLAVYEEAGLYAALLELVDDDANSARDTVAVSVSLGIPVAKAGADTAVSIDDAVIFRGSGVDSNGTLASYEWDVDGDGVVDWASNESGLTQWVFHSVGMRYSTLRVTDNDGFQDVDTVRIDVTDNPPLVEFADLGEGWCGEPETLWVDVSDDGHIALYEWDFEGDGVFDWTSGGLSWATHQFAAGVYFPILRVTDDDGHVSSGSITYRVGPWTSGTPMRVARSGVSAQAVNGRLYAMSGALPEIGAYTAVVEAYDPETDAWETRHSMVLAQGGLATTVLNDHIFGVAGCTSEFERAAVEEYFPEWDVWRRHSSVRERRCWPAAAAVDGLLYVFGGQRGDDIASVEVLNPREGIWREINPMPTPRHGMAAVTMGGKIYLIGGSSTGTILGTVEMYDPATGTWETRTPMPTPRTSLAAVVWNNLIFCLGGSYKKVVEVYDPATDTWRSGTRMPLDLYGHGAGVIGDKIYVVGGETLGGQVAAMQIYAPACDPLLQ